MRYNHNQTFAVMANATLREPQGQYKSCPQNVYLIPLQTAVFLKYTKLHILSIISSANTLLFKHY
jgi:hypothetical protein